MARLDSDPKACFVICQIGSSTGSDIRKNSDQVFKHIVSKALVPLNYKPIRADQINAPGIITTQIIDHLIDDPLVLADLSGQNANVFYELAVRHVTRKPLIMLIKRGEQIPFDVSANRVVQYDLNDLDTVDDAIVRIKEQATTVEKTNFGIDNPISNTLELRSLKSSGNPEQRTLGQVMEEVGALRDQITFLTGVITSRKPPQSESQERQNQIKALFAERNSLIDRISMLHSEILHTEKDNNPNKSTREATSILQHEVAILEDNLVSVERQIRKLSP